MKRRDIEQLKTKPVAELEKLVREAREKLRKLRFDLAAGKVKNVSEIRIVRKGIARMLTYIYADKKKSNNV
ncbi:MAG: 50S ribosomal protein L29 [Patescibacteria group bacterium]|nr:50S ribosomal protein L29 [Patescibacteria group bacterium]